MPPAEPLRPEDPSVVGRYRLTGRLGMGGQGVVYLGSGPDGAKVAVKVLREEIAADPRVRERFMKEIAAARRVDPFCIATVLDASLEGPRPYVVTELVEGPSLQQAGPRGGAAAVHRLAVATATALAAIHDAGIVHRDFKPSNVLLGPDGPRVIDFGIARDAAAPSTLTSSIIGTPAYMAPEQFEGQRVGAPADVFAWGGVVVYAATGRPPFGADTFPAIMRRVLSGEPDLGDLAEPLRSVVISCMAKDPALRPTMRDVLLRLLSARSAATAPPPAATTEAQPAPSGPSAPYVPAGPAQPAVANTWPPMQDDTVGRQQPNPVQRRLVLLASAGALVAVALVITTAAILWPEISKADGPDSGSSDGQAGLDRGTASGGRGANASGDPTKGTSKKSSSPGPSVTKKRPPNSPKASTSSTPSKRPTPSPTKSSGGGGGGGGGSTSKLILTLTGTKRGSCYVNPMGYRYEINYPNTWHEISIDGTIVATGSSASGSSSGRNFGAGTHVIKIRLSEPATSKSVTFTMC